MTALPRVHAAAPAAPSPASAASGTVGACLECGGPVEARQATAEFCCGECRTIWNNRRRKRGAILYDLFMAHRFERGLAAVLKLISRMNAAASNWREEDRQRRAGRPSWQRPADVLQRAPHLFRVPARNRIGRKPGSDRS